MLFLVWLVAGAIVQDYVQGASASKGNLAVSTKAVNLKSNIRAYTVNCTLQFENKENDIQHLKLLENGSKLDAKVINDFTISYNVLLHQNSSDCGEKRYTCEYFGTIIDEQVVTLREPPTAIDATKFKCISENLDYLQCHFPVNTSHCQLETSYSLLMINSDSLESCKLTKVNDSFSFDSRDQSCQYPVDEEVIEFRLRSTNQFGSVSQNIQMDHYDIVRPAAPLKVKMIYEGNIKFLTWKTKKKLNYFGRKFEYNFQCNNQSLIESNYMILSWPLVKTCNQPNVRLRVIPGNPNQDAIWSDWGTFDSTSKVELKSGQGHKKFDESNTDRAVFKYVEINNHSMTIEFFWQCDSPCNESTVEAVSESGTPNLPVLSFLQPTFGTATFSKLKLEKHYIILKGSLSDGFQVQPIIASYQPKFKKLLNKNKSFEVSWYPPDNQNGLKGYTIMYCHLTATRVCEESVVIQKLPPTDTSFNIYSEKTLNFAVSAEFSNYTSSLVWQQCIISPTSNTHNKSPKFHFFDVSSNSLKIRLDTSCEDRSLYERLQVHVIETTSGKTITSKTHLPHEPVVEILDLVADTSYEVLVVAYNSSNVPHEARLRVVTTKTASDDRLSIYTVTGVVLLIAMISSTYRVTVRIRTIMNIEVEFPFGLLGIDEEPVKICVENESFQNDEKGREKNYGVIEQNPAYLEIIQEEELGDELACGRCGVTPSRVCDFEEISQQQDNGYLSVEVIKKKGI